MRRAHRDTKLGGSRLKPLTHTRYGRESARAFGNDEMADQTSDKERYSYAEDHAILVVRQSSRGGRQVLCLHFQELEDPGRDSLLRSRARS